MSCRMCLYALVFLAMAAGFTTAGEFDNCKPFIPIPNEKQNRDPTTLQNLTSRPLGYDLAVIPFNDPNKGNPCFTVKLNDSAKQTVEVMAIGVTGKPTFCVKSNLPKAQPDCQSGIRACQDSAIGDNIKEIKYVFYCMGCETDITFWYRFTVSPEFTNGLDFEYWCQSESNYPDSLITVPNDSESTTTPTSGSWQVSRRFSWLFLLSVALSSLRMLS